MTRPDRNVVLMQTAKAFAMRSTCSRAQVGAVFSKDGRILSTGYNGAPARMEHCQHFANETEGCRVSVHAEANGIAWAARNGVSLDMSTVHTTLSPCYACCQLMINAGVAYVMYLNLYRDQSGLNLLSAAGVGHGPLLEFP